LFCPIILSAQQVGGKVVDEHNEVVIGAQILLVPDSSSTVTDARGRFSIEVQSIPFKIEVYSLGYQRTSRSFEELPADGIIIQLETKSTLLDIVHVSEEHAKQEGSLPTLHLDEDYFKENSQGTFAQQLDALPGLSAINVGTGIAKPVIRGLYGNRILVNNNGIKQEGQQWGNDHGLEIDPFDVQRVEIVKGPAALQYGSDAMGGVINIMQKRIPQENSISGSVTGLYKTNNQHWAGSGQLSANYDNFFLTGRYSYQDFADFSVPADTFVYNGFVLPIFDRTAKNTAGQESNVHITGGYKSKHSITKITYSRYRLQSGFFSGAVGIPRSYTLQPDGDKRDVDAPYQQVEHQKIAINQTMHWGDRHWVLNLGYQDNDRAEHSFPEFHSVPSSQIEPGNTLGLGLRLRTYSLNSHYEFSQVNVKWILGVNGQIQDHRRSGFEYLLPDYRTYRYGLFGLNEWELSSKWTLHSGLRLDYAFNDTEPYTQIIYDSNERIIDSLVSPATEDHFYNYAWALGANYAIQDNWNVKINLARSFRIPYPNESVSNGVHHGTFRHEVGQADLSTETGLQFDASSRYSGRLTAIHFSAYANYFRDYIYLRPSAKFSRLPEAGQIFEYVQNDAFFTGVELSIDQDIGKHFTYGAHVEGLYSINLDEQQALPFTPPASILHYISYKVEGTELISHAQIKLQHRYTLAQNRVDKNERTTPDYHLFQIQANSILDLGRLQLRFDLEVMNVFNNAYLRHLSRYRLLNLPEQGRNIIFRTTLEF
jgi:iron complex outermembrane receptor protein